MSVAREVESANTQYAASFNKGALPLPPARYIYISTPYPAWSSQMLTNTNSDLAIDRKVAIVACMDARLGKSTFPTSSTALKFTTEMNPYIYQCTFTYMES